ncbi:MAG: ThiF family adenylyltransferase [Bacteroidia bacterium]|jgi:hypothetical protein
MSRQTPTTSNFLYSNEAHQSFSLKHSDSATGFHSLIEAKKPQIIDTYILQLKDWIRIRNPDKRFTPGELDTKATELAGPEPDQEGTWIYYPWNNLLIHLLDKEAFIEVRTNRNKLKITEAEQTSLQNKTIGIIGLSVGQSVALTMATERICGRLKLADFDTLDLSNLNRIRSGVQHIGQKKTTLAAHEIAEMDPYLDVECFEEGITEQNIDSFLGGEYPVDLLIEVCDGLDVKILSRIKAREKGIPVIMDTNDRGMLDIERFDLEPQRPLFHGLVDESLLQPGIEIPAEKRLDVLMQLASFNQTSERLKLSMQEIGKSIITWPQLASSVVMGGGITCDVARKLLLGKPLKSGRYYVDLDEFF